MSILKNFINSNDNILMLKYMKILLSIFFIYHVSLWILTIETMPDMNLTYSKALSNWDSGWYNSIIKDGYDKNSIAFYPLYPLIIKLISLILPFNIPSEFIGAFFSTILFIIFNLILFKLFKNKEKHPEWMTPQTKYGYFFFLFAPVSYIFHSSHTESLFLLLSFVALFFSNKNWIIASVIAGLCALTKNQGVILSITIAWLAASNEALLINKYKKFILSGLISFSLYSLFLIYQYYIFSTPFAFMEAQKNWTYITSISEYFKAFFDIVRFKELTRFNIYAAIYYYFLIIYCFLIYKKSKPIFFYSLTCLLLLPLQGSLINAFRYTIFLFPLLFTLGDFLSKRNIIFLILLSVFLIYLNHQMTRNYVLTRWSY